MEETALFSGKIYTADKNFTRPPVATNFKSGISILRSTPGIDVEEPLLEAAGLFCTPW